MRPVAYKMQARSQSRVSIFLLQISLSAQYHKQKSNILGPEIQTALSRQPFRIRHMFT